jgi:hypothetical protein
MILNVKSMIIIVNKYEQNFGRDVVTVRQRWAQRKLGSQLRIFN